MFDIIMVILCSLLIAVGAGIIIGLVFGIAFRLINLIAYTRDTW